MDQATTLALPAVAVWTPPLALLFEVRWGASRVLTRSLRSGRLCANHELAPLLGLRPGDAVAEGRGNGFVVWPRTDGQPVAYQVCPGQSVSWRVGGFTVMARVDPVSRVPNYAGWLLVAALFASATLWQLGKLAVLLAMALLALLPSSRPVVAFAPEAEAPPARFKVTFREAPPPPPPTTLSARLQAGMDNRKLSQLLDHPMPPKPKKAELREAVASAGVLRILGARDDDQAVQLIGVLGAIEGNSIGDVLSAGELRGGVEGGVAFGVGGLGLKGEGVGSGTDRVLRAFAPRLADCGVPAGSVVRVSWRLSGGRVTSATAQLADAELRACVEAAARELSFAKTAPSTLAHRFVVE